MGSKAVIVGAVGVALVAALGAGGHYAWQEGLIEPPFIGVHPRAPLPANFLATLQNDPFVARSLPRGCVRLALYTNREIDSMGRPGLAHQRLPGWDVMVIAQVPGNGGQPIGQLTQAMEALARGGVYSVRDAETDDGMGGKVPARSFALTLDGWKNLLADEQCFQTAVPQVTEIAEYSRVLPDQGDQRVYEVTARHATRQLPAWMNDPALQPFLAQDQLKKLREPATARFRLLRTGDGWVVDTPADAAPDLTRETVTALAAAANGGTPPQACIRLPGSGTVPGVEVTLAPYSATVYETDAQNPGDGRFQTELLWVARLSQLVAAGVFTEQKVAANAALNTPAGTRFALDPGYQKWLDMNDGRCLRMGETTLEYIDTSPPRQSKREDLGRNDAVATAKFLLRLSKDAWIGKVALPLPEVEAVKDAGGVPAVARFAWSDRDKEKQWRLVALQAAQSEPVAPRPPRIVVPPTPAAAAAGPIIASAAAPAEVVAGSAPGGDVTWHAEANSGNGRVTNAGLTVTYCCAGASSATPASRGMAAGRLYAEFTFAARPRALKGDTWTTIGVMPAPAPGNERGPLMVPPSTPTMFPQREQEIAHTDVVGVALDLDAGLLYFSRNGAWLNGQPGSGGGVPLKRGQTHTIVAVLSASSGSGGTDSWTANFGKTRFRHPIPKGFKSYDGRQRG